MPDETKQYPCKLRNKRTNEIVFRIAPPGTILYNNQVVTGIEVTWILDPGGTHFNNAGTDCNADTNTGNAPVWGSFSFPKITAGNLYSVSIPANAATGDHPLSYNLINLPNWASYNASTRTFLGTAPLNYDNSDSFVLEAVDTVSGLATEKMFTPGYNPVENPIVIGYRYETGLSRLNFGVGPLNDPTPPTIALKKRSGANPWSDTMAHTTSRFDVAFAGVEYPYVYRDYTNVPINRYVAEVRYPDGRVKWGDLQLTGYGDGILELSDTDPTAGSGGGSTTPPPTPSTGVNNVFGKYDEAGAVALVNASVPNQVRVRGDGTDWDDTNWYDTGLFAGNASPGTGSYKRFYTNLKPGHYLLDGQKTGNADPTKILTSNWVITGLTGPLTIPEGSSRSYALIREDTGPVTATLIGQGAAGASVVVNGSQLVVTVAANSATGDNRPMTIRASAGGKTYDLAVTITDATTPPPAGGGSTTDLPTAIDALAIVNNDRLYASFRFRIAPGESYLYILETAAGFVGSYNNLTPATEGPDAQGYQYVAGIGPVNDGAVVKVHLSADGGQTAVVVRSATFTRTMSRINLYTATSGPASNDDESGESESTIYIIP